MYALYARKAIESDHPPEGYCPFLPWLTPSATYGTRQQKPAKLQQCALSVTLSRASRYRKEFALKFVETYGTC